MQARTTLRQRLDGCAETSKMRRGPDKYQSVWKQVLVAVWVNSLGKATRQRVFAGEGGYAASHGRRTVVNRLRPKVGTGHGILANLPGQLCVV